MRDQDTVWALTLKLYEAEGVQPACLQLQDQFGVGVSALFALMILGYLDGSPLNPAAVKQALSRAEQWQHTVIEPLRAVRRSLRDAAPEEQTASAEALRQSLLKQEIAAEKLQQALIISDVSPSSAHYEVSASCVSAAYDNAVCYLTHIGQAAHIKAAEPLLQPLLRGLAHLDATAGGAAATHAAHSSTR